MPKIIMGKRPAPIEPLWTTTDGETVRLYLGDVLDVLRRLPGKSVQCVVTSPPYWGLRDYGTDKTKELGSEKTPEEFVEKIVEVFREVRRVLRDDGTLWLNLGDTYSGGASGQNGTGDKTTMASPDRGQNERGPRPPYKGLKPGNLVGIPWRVALALQADGWVLRQDIIWAKPSPMPESVRNRCTKAHEYVFLLTKSNKYFCDMVAIKNPNGRFDQKGVRGYREGVLDNSAELNEIVGDGVGYSGSNKRSVWNISSQGYPGAHFATFPPKLIEPMIKAGTSERGCCAECGAPWRRVVEEKQLKRDRPNDYVKRSGEDGTGNSCSNSVAGVDTRTVGGD